MPRSFICLKGSLYPAASAPVSKERRIFFPPNIGGRDPRAMAPVVESVIPLVAFQYRVCSKFDPLRPRPFLFFFQLVTFPSLSYVGDRFNFLQSLLR